MTKIALSILMAAFLNAKKSIEIGKIYAHYKNPHQQYQVVSLAIDTQNKKNAEVVVIYKSLYLNEELLWSRPVKNWLDIVETNGKNIPRFSKIE